MFATRSCPVFTPLLLRFREHVAEPPKARSENAGLAKPHFTYAHTGEPHFLRRTEIIQKYPHIRELFGVDRRVAVTTALVVMLQLSLAAAVSFFAAPWWVVGLLAFFVGAVLNHWLAMSIHETSHYLVFTSKPANRWLAMFANVPLLMPFAMSFHRYHIAHHRHLGVDTLDSDLPHDLEVKWVGKSRLRKLLWLLFNNVFYVIRGFSFADYPPNRWEFLNLFTTVTSNVALFMLLSGSGLAYLALSTMFGLSFHPVAAHFIHEHYTFAQGQETYSYYGPLNRVTFNVGYHNEHHDFMNIPGARLPELRALAAEYYAPLTSHRSWTYVLFKFVTDPSIGMNSRIVRTEADARAARVTRGEQ